MCLGIPMRIVEAEGPEAVVESGGVRKNVRLDLVDGLRVGDYVLVHTGYAIERVDEKEALETLDLIRQVHEAGRRGAIDPESGSIERP
ncbi:MAG: HypC/HybG/HupF family hydrogenase formation chaperone [Candidatus Krumholzibacteriota bacterium]|nr:HypC/HybG/HupF family hydrogenase formation chaperone [Candidatus Krumholzibacteriota bacterium]